MTRSRCAFDRTVSFSKSQLARGHAGCGPICTRRCGALGFRSGVTSMDSDDTSTSTWRAAEAPRCEPGLATPGFDSRPCSNACGGIARSRRRLVLARGAAAAPVVALSAPVSGDSTDPDEPGWNGGRRVPCRHAALQPRMVRADTFLPWRRSRITSPASMTRSITRG